MPIEDLASVVCDHISLSGNLHIDWLSVLSMSHSTSSAVVLPFGPVSRPELLCTETTVLMSADLSSRAKPAS